ncbi:EKC/KEOPS complex subunit Tp53rk isoform X2 [Venturia canescens]|uniref:EKC/KEOPS complex subunit Tp53rk isoform X2 n=1 Tax=Venturia canescens TaxID=32260 RepID=UPI001C9BEC5D|nr:EKC/KEOPS complex subunit Tp53rk isoform X2 [Venturia canescens]
MEGFQLIGQGAEARLYSGYYLGKSTLVKERFEKKYRHPDLDSRLTKDRIRAEARAIVRAKAAGVSTPTLFLVDLDRRSIYMEYIENARTLKNYFDERAPLLSGEESQPELQECIFLAEKLAGAIAKLHSKNIIHGDLTTSNVLIREPISEKEAEASLVLIDFGLARVESTTEDKAVDLYVLERSLLSSHSEFTGLFPAILSHYVDCIRDKKQRRETIAKYEEVRARGRKRLMVG